MPFPLAHPAAVLPLNRLCPRWLNLPALVIGSLIPDAAYLLGRLKVEDISHSVLGIGLFCLPVGVGLTYLLYWLESRSPALSRGRYWQLLPQRQQRKGVALLSASVSVMIGAATHLVWDAFTHSGGSAAERFTFLNHAIGSFAGHSVRVCRVLWYLSSFVGVAWVYLAFRKAQKRALSPQIQAIAPGLSSDSAPGLVRFLEAFMVAALVLPIEVLHDLVRGPIGLGLVGMLTLFAVVAVVRISSRGLTPAPGGFRKTSAVMAKRDTAS